MTLPKGIQDLELLVVNLLPPHPPVPLLQCAAIPRLCVEHNKPDGPQFVGDIYLTHRFSSLQKKAGSAVGARLSPLFLQFRPIPIPPAGADAG
jgi:hypothetical protein